jgi:hypothetical protein
MERAARRRRIARDATEGGSLMKRLLALGVLVLAALMLPLGAGAQKPESIRIESWLMRVADTGNPLVAGDVVACAKVWLGGTMVSGGSPTWTDATYGSTAADPSGKCGSWTAVGGYRFEGEGHLTAGNAAQHDHVLFARHEITLQGGSIFIQFTGKYSPTFAGEGNWVITGGTGAFAGLQGTGDWEAQGYVTGTGLYFMHTEVGSVH